MNNTLCLIVDDEPVAQRIIANYIADIPDLEVVAMCNNAIAASKVLQEQAIDLLFLDIEMPKIKGLAFAKSLRHPPAIIFTTAHREFALDGFDLGVIDYLLKPVSFERFFQAVTKYKQTKHAAVSYPVKATPTLSFKSDRKTFRVSTTDIVFVEGMGNYIQLWLTETKLKTSAERKLIVYETLSQLMERLPVHFLRIHKSYIINMEYVRAFNSEMIEINQHQLPIGGRYKKQVLTLLEQA